MDIFGPIRTRLEKFYQRIGYFMTKYYRFYLTIVCVFALIGYALVLLFPLLMIAAGTSLYTILSAGDAIDWQGIAIWSVVFVLSSLFSYRSTQIKITPPAGLTLAEDKAPEIYKLVQGFKEHFKRPAIHRIVITSNYELDIVKAPKWALPVWSSNILIIGLPVLLCHSPRQFEAMVARRIGQFSKRHNLLTNWLYQLRMIWTQYDLAYGKQKSPDSYLLKWLYRAYASLYNKISVIAARKDEINADTYAMELFIHDDVREMITANAAYQAYLQNQFWPAIDKIASIKKQATLTPYQNMATAIQTKFKDETPTALINTAFKAQPGRNNPVPGLRERLENIGHDTPEISENSGETAATRYLGNLSGGVINLIDKLWQKDHMEKQKRSRK